LFAESAAASLSFKDQLLANIPEDTIKGFASLCAALGYVVAQHKQIKRAASPQIGYATLFRIFCGADDPSTITLPANDAVIAVLTRKLADLPGWMWLSELRGLGSAERNAVLPNTRPNKVVLNIDGELQVIQPRTVFRGTVPESGAQFMLVVQRDYNRASPGSSDSIGLVYRERDEAAVVALVHRLLHESNPFKDRVVLVNRDLRTVRSRISERSWNDIIPHEAARAELDFIAAAIRNREMLKAEGAEHQARPLAVGAARRRQVHGHRVLRQRDCRRSHHHHRRGGRSHSRRLSPCPNAGAGRGDSRRFGS